MSAPLVPAVVRTLAALSAAERDQLDGMWWGFEWFEVVPPTTACKHHEGTCDRCGTSDRVDAKHTTVAGRGSVARLRGQGKKR